MIFLLGIGAIGLLLLQYSSREILVSSEKQLTHTSELISLKFSGYLEEIKQDVSHLSQSPFLKSYIENREEADRELLTREYLSLLESNTDFFQIRFIGLEEDGREWIRVERKSDSLIAVAPENLQQKGQRDYFVETIRLPADSIYISPIDLNKEYGQLSLPYTPTLRVASPVYDDSGIKGIVVINADLSLLFELLEQITDRTTQLYVINDEGYYLMHEDSTQIFGFEFNFPPSFVEEFGLKPHEVLDIRQEYFRQKDQIRVLDEIPFPRTDYELFVLVSADREVLLQSYFVWRRNSFLIILGLGALFMALAFFYLRGQTHELSDITRQMRAFPKTLEASNLPTNRKDEIGELAQSFNEMSTLILENLNSLRLAREEAESAVREKEEFLENMSHEIRNPLQSIIGMCSVLERNNPAPHQGQIIRSLRFNASNLQSLVNDVLDYKKLLLGDIRLQQEWFSPETLLEELLVSNRYFALTRKVSFTLEQDSDMEDLLIKGDKLRLGQVLNNLIVNAIKFTEPGGKVSLYASVRKEEDASAELIFGVSDSGIGIAPDKLRDIQGRYISLHQPKAFSTSFGLGLSIVSQLLEKMGTRLDIESEQGVGSNFNFVLHAAIRFDEEREAADSVKDKYKILNSLRVLVIDDDQQLLSLYQHIFDERTQSLHCVQSIGALKKLPDQKFDLILSDFRLKELSLKSAYEAVARLLAPEGLFYLVSARQAEPDDLDAPFPVQDCFQKPVEPELLLNRISRDFALTQFGVPNTSSIKKDYDQVREKYARALQLLVTEWKEVSRQLQQAVGQKNRKQFDDLSHKIITSIRRLDLPRFEEMLQLTKQEFEHASEKGLGRRIRQAMAFYIQSIESELEAEPFDQPHH
ncbi:MAG: HAMP domain-containing protein [Bacteroidetes bacterium]|nr:HAMP domain-containing protein [Bacteroidota bacterium]